MNLKDAPYGYAFEGDYAESYGDCVPRLQQVLQRQLDELAKIGTPERAREILGVLRGRRGHRQGVTQIDICTRWDGSDCLFARGEVVLPRASYKGNVIDVIKGCGLKPHRYGGSRPRDLVRLREPARLRSDIERTLDEVHCLGVPAWSNYVMTMAAVGKGVGGPEAVDCPATPVRQDLPNDERSPKVAVIDTGIVEQQREDLWLASVARTPSNIDKLDVLPIRDGYLDFQAGHGTFVAGIVQRVAPEADIRVYRAADTDGFATDDDIADAMIEAWRDGAEIMNLSLAGRTTDDQPPQALADAVARIQEGSNRQVVIVAAAGNYGDTVPCWPAALEGVESVAGLTARLTPADWSSHGSVRFSTVAEGIRSTFVTGAESPVFDRDPETFGADAWALWSGTSFAAPQVAGAVARASRELGRTPREAVELLDDRGMEIPGFGKAMRILEGIR
jgi:thermitase